MYNRKEDFFNYIPTPKSEDNGIPSEEVYLVYDPSKNKWIFEYFNNDDWNLNQIDGRGELYETPYSNTAGADLVASYIAGIYPKSDIILYETFEVWQYDYEYGSRK